MFCPWSRQKIELPLMENVQTIPPPYVVRTVLIYSRHAGQLQFNPSEAFSVSMRTAFFWCQLLLFKGRMHPHILIVDVLVVFLSCHRRCYNLRTSSLTWSIYTTGWRSRATRPAGGWVVGLRTGQLWVWNTLQDLCFIHSSLCVSTGEKHLHIWCLYSLVSFSYCLRASGIVLAFPASHEQTEPWGII